MESLSKQFDIDKQFDLNSKLVNQGIIAPHLSTQRLRDGPNNFFVASSQLVLDCPNRSLELEPGITELGVVVARSQLVTSSVTKRRVH